MPEAKRSKARPPRKPSSTEKKTGFRPGRSGACEAQLWEFTGPGSFLREGEESPVERVAAGSLDDALRFVRRRYPDFIIVKVVAVGMVAILSGSPFE